MEYTIGGTWSTPFIGGGGEKGEKPTGFLDICYVICDVILLCCCHKHACAILNVRACVQTWRTPSWRKWRTPSWRKWSPPCTRKIPPLHSTPHLHLDLLHPLWTCYLHFGLATSTLDSLPPLWTCYLHFELVTSTLDLIPPLWT